MDKKIGKMNIALLAATVLLYLTLFTTYLTSGLYARYTAADQSGDDARVAAFVFDVNSGDGSFILNLSEIRRPGDKEEITFVVKNHNGESTSEVAQNYKVTLLELGSLPLSYTYSCTKMETGQSVTNPIEVQPSVWNAKAEPGECSLAGTFTASGQEAYQYTLVVEWPKEEKEAKYASGSGIACLEIRVLSEQID